jgi:hypothetical protein
MFLLILVFVCAVAYAGTVYLQQHKDQFQPQSVPGKLARMVSPTPPEKLKPAPHGPLDYNILEDQGGQPLADAIAAGLVTDKWAYLSALTPVQISDGVAKAQGVGVHGKHYDLCFKFATKPPQLQYLEFNLEGKWDELHFGFGFDDKEPSDPTQQHAIELTVQADGKTVFGPQRVSPVDKPVFTQLNVKGVNRVVFISKRIGNGNTFAPVLIDPFVKLAAPPPPPADAGDAAAPAGGGA